MGSGFSQPATATMTPAYLVVAQCVAAAEMPGPARAAMTLLHHSPRRPRCFRIDSDEHGETVPFEEDAVLIQKKLASSLHPQPTGAPGSGPARDETASIQLTTNGAFLFICKESYGGCATAYVLAVLIYTQIATFCILKKQNKTQSSDTHSTNHHST
jgi:hypothetical protein